MLKCSGYRSKFWLVLLAAILVLQPWSAAQNEDTEGVTVEKLKDLDEEKPVTDETDHRPEENQMSDQVVTRSLSENEEDGVVYTTGGPVIGSTEKSFEGVEVSVYYGIPYAAAPVGPLRFRPPVRVAPWKTPKMAVKPVPTCYQELKRMKGMEWISLLLSRPWTEDCLTLSIWAPKPKIQGAPVLVHMHGGAFIMGTSVMLIDGTVLASRGVIVVSLSYRLSVFGFFSLGHPDAPGNVGLMDQTLALQWVQENAAAFGGDPKLVTLIGGSAGGASVGYHLLSPMSKGLFSGAIEMGGAPNNPWAVKDIEKAIQKSNALLASLGCANTNFSNSVDCIRGKHAEDILDLIAMPGLISTDRFLPTVDGQFMTEHPDVYIEAGRIASPVPVIIGTAENEGSLFLSMSLQTQDGRVFRRQFQDLIRGMDESLTPLQVKALDVLYTNWSNPNDPFLLRDAARDLYGDYHFVCGTNKLADGLVKAGSNVYRYVFGHPMALGPIQVSSWMGTLHGSEIGPIFSPESPGGRSVVDSTVVEEFRQRIINFLKTRNPNRRTDGTLEEFSWPQYDLKQKSYFHVTGNFSVKKRPRARECQILDELLPALASVGKDC